jgi:predicted Rdx family selenoprotein
VLTRAIAAAQNRQPEGGNPGVDVLQQALSTMLTQRDLGHGDSAARRNSRNHWPSIFLLRGSKDRS